MGNRKTSWRNLGLTGDPGQERSCSSLFDTRRHSTTASYFPHLAFEPASVLRQRQMSALFFTRGGEYFAAFQSLLYAAHPCGTCQRTDAIWEEVTR